MADTGKRKAEVPTPEAGEEEPQKRHGGSAEVEAAKEGNSAVGGCPEASVETATEAGEKEKAVSVRSHTESEDSSVETDTEEEKAIFERARSLDQGDSFSRAELRQVLEHLPGGEFAHWDEVKRLAIAYRQTRQAIAAEFRFLSQALPPGTAVAVENHPYQTPDLPDTKTWRIVSWQESAVAFQVNGLCIGEVKLITRQSPSRIIRATAEVYADHHYDSDDEDEGTLHKAFKESRSWYVRVDQTGQILWSAATIRKLLAEQRFALLQDNTPLNQDLQNLVRHFL